LGDIEASILATPPPRPFPLFIEQRVFDWALYQEKAKNLGSDGIHMGGGMNRAMFCQP
jgi:hypothetical protein